MPSHAFSSFLTGGSNDYTLPLLDYPLWWVVCSSDLVLYTGNVSYLDAYYPVLVKALDTFYPSVTNTTTGLIDKGVGVSGGYGDYAFLPRSGPITYYNALYILALNRAAGLADMLGQSSDSARWRSRAAQVGPALVKENWDASVGAFYDGGPCPNGVSGSKCPVHAQDGNSIAILAGAVNGSSMSESILSYMSASLARPYGNAFYDSSVLSPGDNFDQRVYAFISYFEIAARFATSNDTVGSAFEELRRLYGWMASNDPYLTFWEGIGPDGTPYEGGFTSMAHGWSTGIVPLMVNYVLGVTPTASGFSAWRINPRVDGGGVSWARGTVPTPNGPISVQWEKSNGVLSVAISVPETTSGVVVLPLADGATYVEQDGRQIYSTNSDIVSQGVTLQGSNVIMEVSGGNHTFQVE